jgi:alpha/beta superfamily hydrolase
VALLAVSGCSFGPSKPSEKPDRPDWLSVRTTQERADIVVERVTYHSGALTIYGQVCRPASAGRHPVLIFNHGGFSGITDWAAPHGFCAAAARRGWVLAESSYRGEDGSDGQTEVCLGEVDDVLAMLEVVRSQSYADSRRVAMVGVSHGGCITSRAVERSADIGLAVDIAGPTDWATAMRATRRSVNDLSTNPELRGIQKFLVNKVEKIVGGTPDQYPERYAMRSPDAEKIAQWDKPYLIMHGIDDTIVPVQQSCVLASDVGDFQAYRFDRSGKVVSRAPVGCETLKWSSAPTPVGTFDSDRYLLVYDGVDHSLVDDHGLTRIRRDFFQFLESKLPR